MFATNLQTQQIHLEIVQIGRNFVHHKDVTLYYNSGHGRGGRQSVIVMCFVLCVS